MFRSLRQSERLRSLCVDGLVEGEALPAGLVTLRVCDTVSDACAAEVHLPRLERLTMRLSQGGLESIVAYSTMIVELDLSNSLVTSIACLSRLSSLRSLDVR